MAKKIPAAKLHGRYGLTEMPLYHGEPNLSALIRGAMSVNPNMKAPEVVEYLADDGLEIKPINVHVALRDSKTKRKPMGPRARKIVQKKWKKSKKNSQNTTLQVLLAAKKFINECGGVDSAKEAISVLQQLSD